MMSPRLNLRCRILFPVIVFHLVSSLWASDPEEGSLRLEFEEFLWASDNITMVSEGVVHYGPFTLEAEQVQFDEKKGDLKLVGNVKLRGKGVELNTLFIEGNIKGKLGSTGSVVGSYRSPEGVRETEAGQDSLEDVLMDRDVYIKASYLELRQNKKGEPELILHEVSITDCDQDHPHHDLYMGKLRISKDHRLEAQHLRPRLFGVPYLYLPWLGRDLSRDWPWTRWTLGSSSEWGPFARVETRPLEGRSREKLKLTIGAMSRRGGSIEVDWDDVHDQGRRHLKLFGIAERWDHEDDPAVIEEDRFRADWVERLKLPGDLLLSLDLHYLSERNETLWTGSNTFTRSEDLYSSPLLNSVNSRQQRDSLLKEYFEEEFDQGRHLENQWALERQVGDHHLELSGLFSAEREALLQRYRVLGLKGEILPQRVAFEDLYFSLDYDLGVQGLRLGRAVSDVDVQNLLGATGDRDAQTWRTMVRPRLETRLWEKSDFKVRPYMGWESLGYGRALRENRRGLAFYNGREGVDTEANVWGHRLQLGMALGTTLSASYKGGVVHRLRPSLTIEGQGPSSLDADRVWAPVDRLDFTFHPRLALKWVLNSEWWSEGGVARLDQKLEILQLPRDEDRQTLFGVDLRGDSDMRFYQTYRPRQGLLLYNQFEFNSYVRRMALLKAGLKWNGAGHEWSYGFSRIDDLRGLSTPTHRHDLTWHWKTSVQDMELGLSWDGEDDPQSSKTDRLYEWGFRRLDFQWSRRAHCLRVGVAVEYDFEDSDATLLFRFGPDFLGEHLPEHREGLGN